MTCFALFVFLIFNPLSLIAGGGSGKGDQGMFYMYIYILFYSRPISQSTQDVLTTSKHRYSRSLHRRWET